MKKIYQNLLQKQIVPILSVVFFLNMSDANAQYFTPGDGVTGTNTSTSYPTPFGDSKEGTRAQYLYRASELQAAGMTAGEIREIQWNVTSVNGSDVHEVLAIRIGSTTTNALTSTTWETGLGTARWGPNDIQPVLGVNTFYLSPAFVWDGVSNIILEVCHGSFDAVTLPTSTANASVEFRSGLGFNASHTYADDDIPGGCNEPTTTNTGTQTTRPLTTFYLVPKCDPATGPLVANVKATTAEVTWNHSTTPASNLNSYQYGVNQDRTTPPNPLLSTTDNSLILSGLTPDTKHYLWVKTVCNNINNQYSEWYIDSFTTLPDCIQPPNVKVDRIYGNTAVVTWDPVPTAYLYEYLVSTDKTEPITNGVKTQYNSVELKGLKTNGVSYYFWVKAYCNPTPLSKWTFAQFYSGKELGIEDMADDGQLISVYPNPASNTITIQSKLPNLQGVITITDLGGRNVLTTNIAAEKTNINIEGLASGVYFMKYTNNRETEYLKFVKQ